MEWDSIQGLPPLQARTKALVLQLVTYCAVPNDVFQKLTNSAVRQLALGYSKSSFNNGSLLIYLLARDKSRGEAALESLLTDSKLKEAKALKQDGGLSEINFHELDVSKSDSIQSFAAFVKKEHPDGIDFLINNAGLAMKGFNNEVVETTLQCNYWGTLEMTNTFLPMIKDGGRLVNVASTGGLLNKYSSDVKKQFLAANKVDQISGMMQDFARYVREETHQKNGWPTDAAYSVSKAGLIAATRIIGKEELAKGKGVLVNVCCPGWVVTDMTKGQAATRSPDEGAMTPVMLALDDIQGKAGLFWRHEQLIKWDPDATEEG